LVVPKINEAEKQHYFNDKKTEQMIKLHI
jgi:hypothetical protein